MNEISNQNQDHLKKVKRISIPSRNVIDTFINNSEPFILTDVVTNWPAFQLWKESKYLIETIGSKVVIPVRADFKSVNSDEWMGEPKQIEFEEFLHHWLKRKNKEKEKEKREMQTENNKNDGKQELNPEIIVESNFSTNDDQKKGEQQEDEFYYLASLPMNKYFPTLMKDVVVPEHASEQKKSGNLWIGNKGQITPVHYDFSTGDPGMDGIHALVNGRKKFLLFDPALNANCFRRKNFWGRFHQAISDQSTGLPNLKECPEFANAKPLEIILESGEALFIPKNWWHHVHTLEPSIAVNFWFQHIGSELLKLNRFWPHLEQWLLAVERFDMTEEKLKNVLAFHGVKNLTPDQIKFFQKNQLEFMSLEPFIQSLSNGTRSPWVINFPESKKFAQEISQKGRDWVAERKKRKQEQSEKTK